MQGSTGNGGAVYSANGSPVFTSCQLESNKAVGNAQVVDTNSVAYYKLVGGAAVWVTQSSIPPGVASFANCSFVGNNGTKDRIRCCSVLMCVQVSAARSAWILSQT
jgi:hypothetical protein